MKRDHEQDEIETALGGLRPRSASAETLGPDGQPAAATDRRNVIDDRYQGASEIARGGMGRVLVATDAVLGRTVAVKEALGSDKDVLRRFQREVRITARLEHPSIVPVYDAGTTDDGSPFYVMRKVTGRPLDQLVAEASTLDQSLALVPHVLAAAQAVAHAHERGIVHRDLKPTNILVGALGETVLIDWGLAKVIDEPEDPAVESTVESAGAGDSLRTRIGTVFGTPGFMAPEQVRGEGVDARGDVYALGATLYYVLSRRPPHAAKSGDDMMSAAMLGPPTPIGDLAPGTPRELAAIVDKALAFESERRYADGGAFADDLNRFLKGQLVASHTYTKVERVLRLVRRNRVAVVAVTLALVAIALGSTVAVRRIVHERDRADAAARVASKKRADAEIARILADERAANLMLTQARALVGTDPTAAVASLKLLSADSERWAKVWQRARGIAADARAHGVTFQIPGPPRSFYVEIAPDGTQFLATGSDGQISVMDLGRRTGRTIKRGPRGAHAHFAGNHHVAVFDTAGASYTLFELTAGTQRTVRAPGAMETVGASATHVVWTDERGRLWRCALDSTNPELYSEVAIETFAISPDQQRIAASTAQGIVVFPVAGPPAPLRRLGPRGDANRLVWDAESTTVGATYSTGIGRYYLDGRPPVIDELGDLAFLLSLVPDSMIVATGKGMLRSVEGKLVPIAPGTIDLLTGVQTSIRDLQVMHVDGRVLVYSRYGTGELVAPTSGLSRVVASPRSPYIIGAAPGRFVVWDADAIFPPRRAVDDVHVAYPVDGSDFVVADLDHWSWFDAATGQLRALSPLLPPIFHRVAGRGGHALFTQVAGDPAQAYLVKRDGELAVLHEAATIGGIAQDGTVVLGTARGAVVTYDRDGRSRQTLVARKSDVTAVSYKASWIAAVWSDGTIWRRDLSSKREETRPGPPGFDPMTGAVALLPDGTAMFPVGNKIVRWTLDGATEPVAAMPSRIVSISHSRESLIALAEDQSIYVMPKDGVGRLRPWIPAGAKVGYSLAWDRDLAAVMSGRNSIELSDLTTSERWAVGKPSLMPMATSLVLSSDGRHVGAISQTDSGKFLVYRVDLPETPEATAEWLEVLTNAVVTPDSTTVTWR